MYLEISNMSKKIKGAMILDDINLSLGRGRVYGLKGKNGSGKTMLMRAISGLILPTEGKITIDGKVLGKDMSFPESIGILIENPSFIPYETGFENLRLLASIQKKVSDEEIIEVLKDVGLSPEDRRTYKKYSLGMKQRLGIAAAIMEKPELVLLDEPINALDDKGVECVRRILERLKRNDSLIVIACHDSDELKLLSDEIYLMANGKIIGHEMISEGDKL